MKKILAAALVLAVMAGYAQSGTFVEKEGKIYQDNTLYTGSFSVYEGGVLTTQYEIREGLRHGLVKHYYPNEAVKEIGTYSQGEKDGKWEKWNEQGKKISEAHYKEGKKVGLWLVWDDNGNKRYEMYYKEGEKTGDWKIWDEKGVLTQERSY